MISELWGDLRHTLIILVISTVIFLRGRSGPSGSGPPFFVEALRFGNQLVFG
jgi:hypothetical protein